MRTLITILLLSIASLANAASKQEIDAEVRQALKEFRQHTSAGARAVAEGRRHAGIPQRGQGRASASAASTARARC
jgi:hypothetical protein